MIEKVISGGQIGVDQAGLKAAKNNKIPTGGTAPKGYRTSVGNQLELLKEVYGLEQCGSTNYNVRTAMNVRDADGTIIIAHNLRSPGTRLTMQKCREINKPYFVVDLSSRNRKVDNTINGITEWLKENNISILNVAGNKIKYSGDLAYRLLMTVFGRIKREGEK